MQTRAPTAPAGRRRAARAAAAEGRLLDAAEALFARHGYNGVSIRDIAGAARANISSVYYHFGSKQHLLEAVCRRRMLPVVAERAAAMAAAGGRRASLDRLVAAFVGPTLRAAQGRGRDAAMFRRLAGHLATDPTPEVRRAIRAIFDESVRAFVDGLRAGDAGGDADGFFWSVACAMGAAVYVQGDLAHLARMLGRPGRPPDTKRGLEHIARFIRGGVEATSRRKPASGGALAVARPCRGSAGPQGA